MKYIVPKGFIAIDGTSLTVCEVNSNERWFTFMLVSFTQSKVIVPMKPVGGLVNLEVDVFGKYVEKGITHLNHKVESLEAAVKVLEEKVCKCGDKQQ
jgi:riboflavin synthase